MQLATLTMLFGPTATPRYFQHFIPNLLFWKMAKDTAGYLNDIMVYTKQDVDHKQAVCKLSGILSKHNLIICLIIFSCSSVFPFLFPHPIPHLDLLPFFDTNTQRHRYVHCLHRKSGQHQAPTNLLGCVKATCAQ